MILTPKKIRERTFYLHEEGYSLFAVNHRTEEINLNGATLSLENARDLTKALASAIGIKIGILTLIGDAGELNDQKVFLDVQEGEAEYMRLIEQEVSDSDDDYEESWTDEQVQLAYNSLVSNQEEASSIRWEVHILGGEIE